MDDKINKITREYEEKRRQAFSAAVSRKEEIYARLPRIREIDEKLESTGMNAIRTYLTAGLDKETLKQKLKKENQELRSEKAALLASLGFSPDYLKPVFACPICEDTGYLPDGGRCVCFRQRLIDLSYDASGIRQELAIKNFDTFDAELFSRKIMPGMSITPYRNMQQILAEMKAFSQAFPHNNPHSLIFHGPPGTGKTFLLDCIAKAVLDRGFTVLYLTANQLTSAMEEYRFHRNPQETEKAGMIHDEIPRVDLLILDDLGAEYINQVTAADLFECINTRILSHKSTLISTNLDPEKLRTTYMDRLYSRFKGSYRFIRFFGPDLRTRKQ